MKASISAILIGVRDMDRAKRFYNEGLGWPIQQDTGAYVSFTRSDGSSGIAIYQWDALADDCGVPSEGSGFRGVTLNYFVRTEARVDEILADAEGAGGTIVKPGATAPWGGYSGHFADPDGHLWKIVAGGDHPNLSE